MATSPPFPTLDILSTPLQSLLLSQRSSPSQQLLWLTPSSHAWDDADTLLQLWFHKKTHHTDKFTFIKWKVFLSGRWKKGGVFVFCFFTICVEGGGSMCSLAGSQLSFPEFLRLNLFFLKCRFGAWLLLVTTVPHTYCHTYMRMQLTFCISFVCLFFPCGARKSRVCTTAGQVIQIILSLLDCLFSWAEDKSSKHVVLQFY